MATLKATEVLKIITWIAGAILGILIWMNAIDEKNPVFYAVLFIIVTAWIVTLIWVYNLLSKDNMKILEDHKNELERSNLLREEISANQIQMLEQQKKSLDREERHFENISGLRSGIENIMELSGTTNQQVEALKGFIRENNEATVKRLNQFNKRLYGVEGKMEDIESRVHAIEKKIKGE